ncbi:MAG: DUF4349 domain-containing protein [Candidatus Moranbacteria bacterium]|nr:DUF4349 domain-containing protein [Candidatus Moranbacteria bacterium]
MKLKTKKVLKILAIIIAGIFVISIIKEAYNLNKTKKTSISDNYSMSTGLNREKTSESLSASKTSLMPRKDMAQEESPIKRNPVVNQTGAADESTDQIDKKIIKNSNLDLKVKDIEQAYEEIKNIAKNNQGEIFSSNFRERVKGKKTANITIKVPVANFEKTINQIKETSTQVLEESTKGIDVTEQYVDLQAQIKNKKAQEEAFVKILERSGEISDVLEVTKEISRVRGEIERLEGRIRYLESQTDMSSINVNLSEDAEITPIKKDWRPVQEIKQSASILVKNIQEFVNGSIFFVIVIIPSLIPYLIILGIAYWLGKKIYKKYFSKN